jgi:hypothetical protein
MAMTAERLMQPMRFRVDVRNGLIQEAQYTALMKGDKNANRVIVEIVDNGELVDLTGLLAEGSFIRPPDDARIKLPGTVNGSEAIVIIEEACYRESGGYQLDVELSIGETRRTVLSITGNVLAKGSGAIIDVSGVIPSVDDIVAQYAEMKRVTEETRAARDEALLAAQSANFLILDRFDTLGILQASHPTGEAGQAYAVGSEEDNVVYIWGVDTLAWVNIGKVQGPRGFRGEKGDQGDSPTVTLTREADGVVITTNAANGTQSEKINDGAQYDQGLNKADDVVFNSIQTTEPLDADSLGGKTADSYALKEKHEEWSFTLESGTTVKKKVLVVD